MKTDTLTNIVTNVRHEIGAAPGTSQGIANIPSIKYLCSRIQDQLYDSFNWPHLIHEYDDSLVAGTRYYNFLPNLNRDRVLEAWVNFSSCWRPLEYGFDSMLYNSGFPETTYRSDPVQAWRFHNDTQYEVWPTPASAQTMRWRFVSKLTAFTADSDVSCIDSNLIALFVAAELLTRMKSADAEMKTGQAQAYLQKIKSQMMPAKTFVYGGEPKKDPTNWVLKTKRI